MKDLKAEEGGLLPNKGLYSFRKDGEKHAWNPETISTLQLATVWVVTRNLRNTLTW